MDRIKDLTKVILQSDQVLMKMLMKQGSKIIMPDANGDSEKSKYNLDYCVVIHKGVAVSNVEIGDIVLTFSKGIEYTLKGEKYLRCSCHAIEIAVKPDNFEVTSNLTIN